MSRKNRKQRCAGRGDYQYWQSADLNFQWWLMYYQAICEMAANRFKWVGLPDSISERYLEETLLNYNVAVIFRAPWFLGDRLLASQVTWSGKRNLYNDPVNLTSFGANGWRYKLSSDNGVVCWGSRLRYSIIPLISLYAMRLANIDRTLEVNINAQKTPILLLAPESKRTSVLNMYAQYSGNEPAVMGYDQLLDGVEFKALKTDAPFIAKDLLDVRAYEWNQLCTLLGIDNANTEKRERMISDEVNSNNGQILATRLGALNARRECARELVKKYPEHFPNGLDVVWSVDNASDEFNWLANPLLRDDEKRGE